MPASLYDRPGGQAVVNTAVDIFYRKILTDQRANHLLNNLNCCPKTGSTLHQVLNNHKLKLC